MNLTKPAGKFNHDHGHERYYEIINKKQVECPISSDVIVIIGQSNSANSLLTNKYSESKIANLDCSFNGNYRSLFADFTRTRYKFWRYYYFWLFHQFCNSHYNPGLLYKQISRI